MSVSSETSHRLVLIYEKTKFKFLVRLHGEYNILVYFVETPRKFIIAKLSIRKLGSLSMLIIRLFEFTRPFL